jgi:hypothetical protein
MDMAGGFTALYKHSLFTWQMIEAYTTSGSWATSSVNYSYSYYLPTPFRAPTNLGATTWNNVTTSSWNFNRVSNSNNYVEYAGIDGPSNTIATTTKYKSGNQITRFIIRYDSSESWYTGSAIPGSNQFDAWSVVTHEFGHALGLGHTQSANCPGNYNDATMCDTITRGEIKARSLATDDVNGVAYLYP